MEITFTYPKLFIGLLLSILAIVPAKSIAQPDYHFSNHTLLSGTDREIGAVYLFPGVKPGIDARVTITDISQGATLEELDGTSGYPEALQPNVSIAPYTRGYVEMYIEFLISGTSTLAIQAEVPVTCIDVDGSSDYWGLGEGMYEFDEVDLGGGYVNHQLTGGELSVSRSGTWFLGQNAVGVEYPGRDTTAKQVMFTMVNAHISSCIIRVGVDNQSSIGASRQRSVYFQKFTYPNSILSKSSLISFHGIERNNAVSLNWKIEKENNLKKIVIERAYASGFTQIGYVNISSEENKPLISSFQDNNKVEGKTFYRLKLISQNGTFKYSNVIMFNSKELANDFKVYPAVINNSATIQLRSEISGPGTIQLVNYSGGIILQRNIQVQAGSNHIAVDNLGTVHPGNYVVVLRTNGRVYTQKVSRQ